jgi:hypothetical protein
MMAMKTMKIITSKFSKSVTNAAEGNAIGARTGAESAAFMFRPEFTHVAVDNPTDIIHAYNIKRTTLFPRV